MVLPALTKPSGRKRGFSLIEILVVIGVMGIIAALGIPVIGNLFGESRKTTSRANARGLATISTSLSVLGVEHVIPLSLGGKEATCRLLKKGIVVSEGPMLGVYYGMPGLKHDEIPLAAEYLDITYANLNVLRMIYSPGFD